MAKRVVTAAVVTIGGTDYSSEISDARLSLVSDAVESTNYGSSGWREFLAGLRSGTLTINFRKDSDLSGLDSAIWTNYSAGTVTAWTIKGDSAATSTTNPVYSGNLVLTEWNPIEGAVGALFEGGVSWQITGSVTRATS